MNPENQVPGIAHVIQLAVAPVFLLTAVGATLGVFTNRLTRIVDRARYIEGLAEHPDPAQQAHWNADLALLIRRSRLINRELTLSTTCGLLVSLVVVALFLGATANIELSRVIAFLFIAAMAAFIAALLCFLREIFIATAGLRIGKR